MKYSLSSDNQEALKFNISCAPIVENICSGLFASFNIKHFGCIRMFKDGKLLRIANNENWSNRYFEGEFFNDPELYSLKDISINKSRVSFLTGAPLNEHCTALKEEFHLWNYILIYERFDDYGDLWFFGSNVENQQIINFYINNIATLHKFISYFKNKAGHLFDIEHSSKLITTKINPFSDIGLQDVISDKVLREIDPHKYYLEGKNEGIYLSKRQFECVFLLSKGKTIKEIAIDLSLSARTVEAYINSAKIKLDCFNKSEIVSSIYNC